MLDRPRPVYKFLVRKVRGKEMITASIEYICPKCKIRYTSLVPLKFCVCGSLLVPRNPDPIGAIKDLFEKTNPFSVDMFRK